MDCRRFAAEATPTMLSFATAVGEVERAIDEVSPNPTDRKITVAHLIDGAMHHLAHTMRHLDRLTDPKVLTDADATKFNISHAEHHAAETQDHLNRASCWLEEQPSDPAVYQVEKQALKAHKYAEPV